MRLNFEMYDTDRDGRVTFAEVRAVFERYNMQLSEQIADYLHRCDQNGDGSLSFEEFVTFVNGS